MFRLVKHLRIFFVHQCVYSVSSKLPSCSDLRTVVTYQYTVATKDCWNVAWQVCWSWCCKFYTQHWYQHRWPLFWCCTDNNYVVCNFGLCFIADVNFLFFAEYLVFFLWYCQWSRREICDWHYHCLFSKSPFEYGWTGSGECVFLSPSPTEWIWRGPSQQYRVTSSLPLFGCVCVCLFAVLKRKLHYDRLNLA